MKKGFTLIELLAVIVILAIIALIATPIILNIISDSSDASNKRSIELYAKAIENAISDYMLNNEGSIPTKEWISNSANIDPYYNGNRVVCDTQEINSDGTIYLEGCKINGKEIKYTYGTSNIICRGVTEETATKEGGNRLAGNIPTGEYKAGDEYICNVDGVNKYHFFVLEDGDTSGLIKVTEETLGSDETANLGTAGEGEIALVVGFEGRDNTSVTWCKSGNFADCKADGAMEHLKEMTAGWTIEVNLPTYNQINMVANNDTYVAWLSGTYWTSTKVSESRNYLEYPTGWSWDLSCNLSFNEWPNQVLPVITVPKSAIK